MIFLIVPFAIGIVLTYFGGRFERPVMRNYGVMLLVGPAIYLGLTLVLG